MPQIDQLLKAAVASKASDLHLASCAPARLRVDGDLIAFDMQPLDSATLENMLFEILTDDEKARLLKAFNIDRSYSLPGVGNFRVNMFYTRVGIASVIRTIPSKIPELENLGLPAAISTFTELPKGLVLVTGPTGSGKSTTLAAMIDVINRKYPYHILTVEDPIEFVHESKQSLINQREIGNQCHTFADALKYALREDPDVILVGEMRDLETIALALTAAETGHLVFGTLHTRGAGASVDRIIDSFPANQQAMIRAMLSESLAGVVSQALLKRATGSGRVAAVEILVVNHAVANLIREGKTFQIPSIIQTGKKEGMLLMDQHILELVDKGVVSPSEAEAYMEDPSPLASRKSRMGASTVPSVGSSRPPSKILKPIVPTQPQTQAKPASPPPATKLPGGPVKTPQPVATSKASATVNPPPIAVPKSNGPGPGVPEVARKPPPLRPGAMLSVAKAAPQPPPVVEPLAIELSEPLADQPDNQPPLEENSEANVIEMNTLESELQLDSLVDDLQSDREFGNESEGPLENSGEDVLELMVPEAAYETRIEEKEQTGTFDIPPLHQAPVAAPRPKTDSPAAPVLAVAPKPKTESPASPAKPAKSNLPPPPPPASFRKKTG
ncbi:MAG: PilT/PilU family type 4a pilus ATPase [Deltaproteobacteria bacterium]|nr:PilT/PilU family type 4a pilus ATPase [Deltaproteobacteria bacterium]